MELVIDGHPIGTDHPTYFIADIAANHDGSLERARELIRLAKEAGADAAKFQHFKAAKIVSDVGFDRLETKLSHQASWTRSVTEVYADASVPDDWTPHLKAACDEAGITFFSSPYDQASVDALDPYVPAYKLGSGDIDWLEEIAHIASKGKPVIVATGAATMAEVERAMDLLLSMTDQVALLQCNTNYTAEDANFDHLHLNVLRSYAERWPDVVLGLSDHTHGPAAVLGAVALGGRIIERHFTDDNDRDGPDHRFALDPAAWADMVSETRRLERALGSPTKHIAENEIDTAVVQRRCLRAARDLDAGHVLTRADIDVLRPATPGAISPAELDVTVGRVLAQPLASGVHLRPEDLDQP
ncbi:MAG: N-acetylneuraminate synthase family protein [Acidimicrobiia bacterium]|nr:N-acetylneuraminate synthase family protein [Acidimicrobiia bacterium]